METEELDKEVEARETIIGLQPPEFDTTKTRL